ncbi:hypothetical protein HDU83_004655 [Entophlyctis luteolus]|nr:hypothetical protein HDU83_004655 [Entophlyctis luteolus]
MENFLLYAAGSASAGASVVALPSASVSDSRPSFGWSWPAGGESELLPRSEQIPGSGTASSSDGNTLKNPSAGKCIEYKDELVGGESYFGFVEDETDALVLIQATIANIISSFSGSSVDMARLRVRSGSVYVLEETSRFVKRWKVSDAPDLITEWKKRMDASGHLRDLTVHFFFIGENG